MSKKKGRNKIQDQAFRVSPGPGIFYSQKLCGNCKKLILGSSSKSHNQAERDLGLKMQAHKQDCQSKKLKLSLPGREGKKRMSQEKVYQGRVKSYDPKKGYGFIAREDNQGDIFFHVSDLVDRDHNPQQNDKVEFEIAPGRAGKQKAVKVKKID